MRLYEKRRRRRRRQRLIILSIFALLTLCLTFLLVVRAETRCEAPGEPTELSGERITVEAKPVMAKPARPEAPTAPEFAYSKDWDADDSYLLAKIAMAEAEGEPTTGKALVIQVVLNRVWSKDFPDTIREVLYQNGQFSPIANGRFDAVEPNADCWAAVDLVMEAQYDYSKGALYFESCDNTDNWHNRTLEFLYQVGNHRFYK